MSLVVFAIGVEGYQFLAHLHCLFGRALPDSHRSTVGFGAAIAADALSYLVACVALWATGGPWMLLLLPLFAHLVYGCTLVFFRPFYSRLHDYRRSTIYADGSFCRAKAIASVFDSSGHLIALVLLARSVSAATALSLTALGVVAYMLVFRNVRLMHATLP